MTAGTTHAKIGFPLSKNEIGQRDMSGGEGGDNRNVARVGEGEWMEGRIGLGRSIHKGRDFDLVRFEDFPHMVREPEKG